MNRDEFHRSFNDCLEDPAFIDHFYDGFIHAAPEIEAMFAGVDMDRQRRALRLSLYVAASYTLHPTAYITKYLHELGKHHQSIGARSAHYDLWLDCLITSVAAFDDHFSETTEAAWRAVMKRVIEVVASEDNAAHAA